MQRQLELDDRLQAGWGVGRTSGGYGDADEIIRGGAGRQGYDLKVYSCRPKLHWNPYMTVEFEGEFYQMFKEEPANGSRRFIYYLRKNPVGRLVVVIDHYEPDDVLEPRSSVRP